MDVKSVTRRLDELQQEVNKNRPCKMTVTFADGRQIVTDQAGAIDLFREHGPFGAIDHFEADQTGFRAAATIWTVLCHPAPNREVTDFE